MAHVLHHNFVRTSCFSSTTKPMIVFQQHMVIYLEEGSFGRFVIFFLFFSLDFLIFEERWTFQLMED